jgi:hypothetical protein
MSAKVLSQSLGFGHIPTLDDILRGAINYDVEDDPMVVWDRGVFLNELQKQRLVLSTDKRGAIDGDLAVKRGLQKGTFFGTKLALTEMYSLIEKAYSYLTILLALQILRFTN